MTTPANNQICLIFLLSDFEESPDEITKLLGITPTSVTKAGTARRRHTVTANSWSLEADASDRSLDEHFQTVFAMLEPCWPAYMRLAKANSLEIICQLWREDENRPVPELFLSRVILDRMSEIDAEFGIEVY